MGQEAADKLDDADIGQKIGAYEKLLQDTIEDAPGLHTILHDLRSQIDTVQSKGQTLRNLLRVALDDLDYFMQHCNQLFTGVGPRGEYLQDICVQTGTACIEEQ